MNKQLITLMTLLLISLFALPAIADDDDSDDEEEILVINEVELIDYDPATGLGTVIITGKNFPNLGKLRISLGGSTTAVDITNASDTRIDATFAEPFLPGEYRLTVYRHKKGGKCKGGSKYCDKFDLTVGSAAPRHDAEICQLYQHLQVSPLPSYCE